jgi:23S rRNA (guanosine2251-2'-O)-methyltransferase
MAGNSQRKGATRNAGSKKGATVGSGGQRRKALKGKGPTPKATERSYHPAAKRERAAAKRAEVAAKRAPASTRRGSAREDGSMLMGRNPVVEALRAKVPAKALYVQARLEADDRLREALRLAVASNIALHEVAKPELDRMTEGGAHQGMVLTVPAYDYADLDDIRTGSLLIALDGVTDPRNLGAVARSAAAFGADGIVIPSRRSAGVSAAAWKTSAGALARVPVAQVTNLTRALESLQKDGFTVVGLAADGPEDIGALPVLTDRLVLVIGSEGAGLSRLVGETCDWLARISMRSGTESLNASVAAGIALHAVFAARA